MTIRNATVRGRRLASQNGLGWKPYRRFGDPNWDPAAGLAGTGRRANPSPELKQAEAAQRQAEFARLRAEGVPVNEAGAKVGIRPDTARRYEQRRKKALAGGAG